MVVSDKYIITAPTVLKKRKEGISKVPANYYLLKTIQTSICKADLRYYFGERPPEVLEKAYPLCLFHEGTAIIEKAGKNTNLKKGTFVVPIPNIPCYVHNKKKYRDKKHACESCRSGGPGENYCLDAKFMSSSADGFARSYFLQPKECVVTIPKNVPKKLAVLSELLSVARGAIREAEIKKNDKVVVMGDGPVGYLVSSTLHFVNKIPKKNLIVSGITNDRLKHFKSFATPVNVKNGFPKKHFDKIDKILECAGSQFADITINQAVNLLKPGGICVLMGVSEHKVPIATRNILAKNLTFKGISRSPIQDYAPVLNSMKDKKFQKVLEKVIIDKEFKVNSIEDLHKAFRATKDKTKFGKIVIDW